MKTVSTITAPPISFGTCMPSRATAGPAPLRRAWTTTMRRRVNPRIVAPTT